MKNFVILFLVTTLLLVNGCNEEGGKTASSGHAAPAKTPPKDPKSVAPNPKPVESPTKTPTAATLVAPTTPPTNQPIPLGGERKSPRIDVIGREGSQLSINVYFDNQLLCTISGKIDAKVHRPFPGGFIAEGACYSDKIVSQGLHEYKLLGRLIQSDGSPHEVSFASGPRNVTGVVQPAIEMNQEGKLEVRLAVD